MKFYNPSILFPRGKWKANYTKGKYPDIVRCIICNKFYNYRKLYITNISSIQCPHCKVNSNDYK